MQSPNATLEQAAKYLQVSPRSVQNYQDRGLLKAIYFGRRRFFRWAELQKLAKAGVSLNTVSMVSGADKADRIW